MTIPFVVRLLRSLSRREMVPIGKVKMPRLLPLILILLVTACGAITIEIDTLVKDENDITHNFSLMMLGPIATMAIEEADDTAIDLEDDFFTENCDQTIDEVDGEDRIEFTCSNVSHEKLLSSEQGDENGFNIYR